MKTLHLLRHAKSSWDNPTLDDHNRPLAARGARPPAWSPPISPATGFTSTWSFAPVPFGLARPSS